MKIISIVVTCNRLSLLPRALHSIKAQMRKPDLVIVVSNSEQQNIKKEKLICKQDDFLFMQNQQTKNYAGALNIAVEEIIKRFGIAEDIYFASLDDDDEWLPDYLQEIENSNTGNYDLLAGNILRICPTEDELMNLPSELSERDFLTGNPGIFGSNTFVRLTALLYAGGFDEAMSATVDRDFFIRFFQQRPKYKIINKHLVNQYADNDRERITTSGERKKRSLQNFFYKYCFLMSEQEKKQFFERAEKLFSIPRITFTSSFAGDISIIKQEIQFSGKGNYQFIIGFIAGDAAITERIIKQIIDMNISVDLLVIVDNTPKTQTLSNCEKLLRSYKIQYKMIKHKEWQQNLAVGHYGSLFKDFSKINSIPLGRTILHHHLFTETVNLRNPVYWIIDDDISFTSTLVNGGKTVNLFEIINQHLDSKDGIIGGISNDPPVPTLSCIRAQLVDFLHSYQADNALCADHLNLREKPDYYYDLSDLHSDHLEMPIYYQNANETTLRLLFSGKSVSRPALQNGLKAIEKTVTKRGANTLVLNRDLLHYYPVINLEINNQFARRGDLLWTLLNQIVSGKNIIEHTFSLDHNRPQTDFVLSKELEKSGYDIIGYAFNKAILQVVEKIKMETVPHRAKKILEKLNQENYYQIFLETYHSCLEQRKTKFLMNYYRIIGLVKILSSCFQTANSIYNDISQTSELKGFFVLLEKAQNSETIKSFFNNMLNSMWSYSSSITKITENETEYQTTVENYFHIKGLEKLGAGSEGIVFTDKHWVYKIFYEITESDWHFLKEKSECFINHKMLEKIECFEIKKYKIVRYPYRDFKSITQVNAYELISFLKFCKENNFVFTNIAPKNFIQIFEGQLKLIDYGKSFEPFSEEYFINSIKRAYLLWKYPTMQNDNFQKITSKINIGKIPKEITDWKMFLYAVSPRTKEEILDTEIISILKKIQPRTVLDYGAGKCKTAKAIKQATNAEIFVFDIDTPVIEKYGRDFPKYEPTDRTRQKFDTVLLNIVLCVVENTIVNDILSNISKIILPNGKLIVSICNPDFAHIKKMEFQNRDFVPRDISKEEMITKTCIYTGNQKIEYHRPTKKYLDLFSKYGFEVEQIIDTYGVDIETLKFASDFKIFILKRTVL